MVSCVSERVTPRLPW